jgi:hypothetical protein
MGKLTKKLKAATLMESLIAMIIIIVCFGIGTMIYSNVLSSDKQRLKLKAILLLNQEAASIKKEHLFIDGEKQQGDYLIKRMIKKMNQTENVYILSLVAVNKEGKIIGTRNELIIVD